MKSDIDKLKKNLHILQGQLKGIEKMIDENTYCIDVSNQILSSIALLKKINVDILSAHLNCCVLNAAEDDKKEKIDEIVKVLKRME